MSTMKVTPEHFALIETAIRRIDTEELRQVYRERRIPRAEHVEDIDVRYRWDLFWAIRPPRFLTHEYKSSHIDTALRRIVPPLEEGGQRQEDLP